MRRRRYRRTASGRQSRLGGRSSLGVGGLQRVNGRPNRRIRARKPLGSGLGLEWRAGRRPGLCSPGQRGLDVRGLRPPGLSRMTLPGLNLVRRRQPRLGYSGLDVGRRNPSGKKDWRRGG